MWMERFLRVPLMEDAGWEDESTFLSELNRIGPGDMTPRGFVLPLKSSMDGVQYLLPTGLHTLVLGATGSGKTRDVLAHGVMNAIASKTSAFVLDVKGELKDMTVQFAKKQCMKVYTIDLREMKDLSESDYYSPLQLAENAYWIDKDPERAEKIVSELASMLFPRQDAAHVDSYWATSQQALFVGTTMTLLKTETRNVTIPEVARLIGSIEPERPNNSELMHMVRKECGTSSREFGLLAPIINCGEKQLGNVLSCFSAAMFPYQSNKRMTALLSNHSVSFEHLKKSPCIVYFEVDDSNDASYQLAQIMVSQLYHLLVEEANRQAARCLKIPFIFFLDELGNSFKISQFERMMSMARSRGITFVTCLQTVSQLEQVYRSAAAETILSNFSVMMCLSTFSAATWKTISALCGKNILGDDLLRPDQIALLQRGQCLVLRRGYRPFMSTLADITCNPYMMN